MSEENNVVEGVVLSDEVEENAPITPKLFTRDQAIAAVTVLVHLPRLYPDLEPWEFKMRLKLSEEAEERRQMYAALTPSEQTVRAQDQALDEVCDLLVSLPKGFGDLKYNGKSVSSSFKEYVLTSPPYAKAILLNIVEGASTAYWRKVMPYEFRPEVQGSV